MWLQSYTISYRVWNMSRQVVKANYMYTTWKNTCIHTVPWGWNFAKRDAKHINLSVFRLHVTYKPSELYPVSDVLIRSNLPDTVPKIGSFLVNVIDYVLVIVQIFKSAPQMSWMNCILSYSKVGWTLNRKLFYKRILEYARWMFCPWRYSLQKDCKLFFCQV